MNEKDTGGPAFPMQEPQAIHSYAVAQAADITDPAERDRVYTKARAEAVGGMTLRQYAAIHLKVPDSGTDWLDDMIRKSQRNELAAKAMQLAMEDFRLNINAKNSALDWDAKGDLSHVAYRAYELADATLKAGEA